MRKFLSLVLACVLLTGISSCVPALAGTVGTDALFSPNDTLDEAVSPVFTGESVVYEPCDITVYYASSQDSVLHSAVRSIIPSDFTSPARGAVEYLLSVYDSFPAGTKLDSLIVSRSNAFVCLSVESLAYTSDRDKNRLIRTVSDTLLEIDGISSVTVLCGGRLWSVGGRTVSALCRQDASMSEELSGLMSLLFVPSDGCVLSSLCDPSQPLSFGDTWEGIDVTVSDAVISERGFRVLPIHITGSFSDETLAAASLTCLMEQSDTDCVQLFVNGKARTSLCCGGISLERTGGLFTAAELLSFLPETCEFALPQDGSLVSRTCRVPAGTNTSPRAFTRALFDEYAAAETFGLKISGQDVLGVDLSRGILSLDLSASFYGECQSLTREEEFLFTYSVVNTLTSLPTVTGVRIFIDGGQADVLAHDIFLKTVLLANPGLASSGD